ncbi:MAG: hypothetical protein ACPL3C_08370 [Pyrobaculum sp.]
MVIWIVFLLWSYFARRDENPWFFSGAASLLAELVIWAALAEAIYAKALPAHLEMAASHILITSAVASTASLGYGAYLSVAGDVARKRVPGAPDCLVDVVAKYAKVPETRHMAEGGHGVDASVAEAQEAVANLAPDDAEASGLQQPGEVANPPPGGELGQPDGHVLDQSAVAGGFAPDVPQEGVQRSAEGVAHGGKSKRRKKNL